MLKIRLQRVGRKHEPVFRLVVVDSHEGPKTGNVKEVLGSYDSRRGDKAEFKTERIKHWIEKGAQTSGTVHNLLVSKNIVDGKKVNVLPKKKPILKEQPEAEKKEEVKAEAVAEAAPTEEPKEETAPEPEVPVESETPTEEVKRETPEETPESNQETKAEESEETHQA